MAPDQGLNLTSLGMPSGLADLQCNCIFSKENSEKKGVSYRRSEKGGWKREK